MNHINLLFGKKIEKKYICGSCIESILLTYKRSFALFGVFRNRENFNCSASDKSEHLRVLRRCDLSIEQGFPEPLEEDKKHLRFFMPFRAVGVVLNWLQNRLCVFFLTALVMCRIFRIFTYYENFMFLFGFSAAGCGVRY